MEEYAGFLNFKYFDKTFMFKITVDQDQMEDFEGWEGSVNHLKRINEHHFSEIKSSYSKQMDRLDKLEQKVDEFSSRDVNKQIFAS